MNRLTQLAVIVTLAMTASFSDLHAQQNTWINTNGPYGGNVVDLLDADGYLYAAAGSLHRSSNRGETWIRIASTPGTGQAVPPNYRLLARDSTGAVIALTDYSLERSTNRGVSWASIDLLGYGGTSMFVAADSSIYRVVYGTLYRLRPGDDRSTPTGFGGPGSPIIAATKAHDGTLYTITSTLRTFYSDDNGESWGSRFAGDSALPQPTSLTAMSNGDLVATSAGGLIISRDRGVTWSRDQSSIRERIVTEVVEHGGEWYVGTMLFGAFRSGDHGATWTEITPGLENPNVWALATSGSQLFAGTSRGVQATADRGATWRLMSNGLLATAVNAIMTKGSDVYAATPTGMYRSVDRGAAWSAIDYGLVDRDIMYLAVDSAGSLVALSRNGVVFRSTDNGNEWVRRGAIDRRYSWGLTVTSSADLIAAATNDDFRSTEIVRSSDGGETWETICVGLDATAFAVGSDGSLIAVTSNSGIQRSESRGATWSQLLPRQGSNGFSFVATDVFGGIYALGYGVFARSTNNGQTWTSQGGNGGQSIAASPRGFVIMSTITPSPLALYSKNQGLGWNDASSGLGGRVAEHLHVAGDGTVYASTAWGGVIRTTSQIAPVPPDREDPATALRMPSPHPVRGQAMINFRVGRTSHVRLSLHDIRGNEVAVLHDGTIEAGDHAVAFDAAGLSSGVYACRLNAGTDVRVTRFVVE